MTVTSDKFENQLIEGTDNFIEIRIEAVRGHITAIIIDEVKRDVGRATDRSFYFPHDNTLKSLKSFRELLDKVIAEAHKLRLG